VAKFVVGEDHLSRLANNLHAIYTVNQRTEKASLTSNHPVSSAHP
jgi:hypothetical protein